MLADERGDAFDAGFHHIAGGTVGESHPGAVGFFGGTGPVGAHVEEAAGHGHDLAGEAGVEEGVGVVEGRWQVADAGPHVEGAAGLGRRADAEFGEAVEHELALVGEFGAQGGGFLLHAGRFEGREGGALGEHGRTAVHGAGRAVQHFNDVLRAHGPAGAPAGIAVALGEAVENDDGILVHVFHEFRRGNGAGRGRAVGIVDEVGIEFVAADEAVFPAGRGHIAVQGLAGNDFARGVAGIGKHKDVGAFLMNEAFQRFCGNGEGVFLPGADGKQHAAVAEAVEIVLVGCVVGIFVGYARAVGQNGVEAGEGQTAAACEADVVRRVLRLAAAIGSVDHVGNGFAHFAGAAHRAVGMIGGINVDVMDAFGRAGHVADFGLSLTEVAPVGISVPEAELRGLVNNPDDAHVGNVPDHGKCGGHLRIHVDNLLELLDIIQNTV